MSDIVPQYVQYKTSVLFTVGFRDSKTEDDEEGKYRKNNNKIDTESHNKMISINYIVFNNIVLYKNRKESSFQLLFLYEVFHSTLFLWRSQTRIYRTAWRSLKVESIT